MDHPTFRPKIHRAPSERRKKSGGSSSSRGSSGGSTMQRLQGEKASGYVTSPGQVAKHSSALSREEVIEYRRLQSKDGEGARMEVTREEIREGVTTDVVGSAMQQQDQQKQKQVDVETRSTTSASSSSSSVRARRSGRHATRSTPKPIVQHLPNRHRKQSPEATRAAAATLKKKKMVGMVKGGTATTSASLRSSKGKQTEEERADAATSNMLRARLLKSRRRTPTKSMKAVEQQQQGSSSSSSRRNFTSKENYMPPSVETVGGGRGEGGDETMSLLPQGWKEYVNEQGFVYYGHVDGRSQWNTPLKSSQSSGVQSSRNNNNNPSLRSLKKVQASSSSTTLSDSPSREELDTMIRGMGQDFLKSWKTK